MKKSFRLSALLAVTGSILSGSVLFWASQAVQTAEAEQRRLQDAVAGERETIRVLQAEWAYLTRPDRLEELARDHLHMVPPDAARFTTTADSLPSDNPPAVPARKPTMAAQAAVFTVSPAADPAVDEPAPRAKGESSGDFRNLLGNLQKGKSREDER